MNKFTVLLMKTGLHESIRKISYLAPNSWVLRNQTLQKCQLKCVTNQQLYSSNPKQDDPKCRPKLEKWEKQVYKKRTPKPKEIRKDGKIFDRRQPQELFYPYKKD